MDGWMDGCLRSYLQLISSAGQLTMCGMYVDLGVAGRAMSLPILCKYCECLAGRGAFQADLVPISVEIKPTPLMCVLFPSKRPTLIVTCTSL